MPIVDKAEMNKSVATSIACLLNSAELLATHWCCSDLTAQYYVRSKFGSFVYFLNFMNGRTVLCLCYVRCLIALLLQRSAGSYSRSARSLSLRRDWLARSAAAPRTAVATQRIGLSQSHLNSTNCILIEEKKETKKKICNFTTFCNYTTATYHLVSNQ